jgi:hypothetical protein
MSNLAQTYKATITNHYVSGSIHGGILQTFTVVMARPNKTNMTSLTVYHHGLINDDCYKTLIEFIHSYLGKASKLDENGKVSIKKGKILEIRVKKIFDTSWDVDRFLTWFDGAVNVSAANAA